MYGVNPPFWARQYIGLPYLEHGRGPKEYDCYGLALAVLRDQFGKTPPDYADLYVHSEDDKSVSSCIRSSVAAWKQVPIEEVQPGDVLTLRVMGLPVHVAVVVDSRNMLHTMRGMNSTLASYVDRTWRQRIEGVYRWME